MSDQYIYSGMYDPKLRGLGPNSQQKRGIRNEYTGQPRYKEHLDGHRNSAYMDEQTQDQQHWDSGKWKYREQKPYYCLSPWSYVTNHIYGQYGNKRHIDENPYENDANADISKQNISDAKFNLQNDSMFTADKKEKNDAWIGWCAIIFGVTSVFTFIAVMVCLSIFLLTSGNYGNCII